MEITFIKKTLYQKTSEGIEIKSGEVPGIWNGIQKKIRSNEDILDIEGDFNTKCYIYGINNNIYKLLLEIPPTNKFTYILLLNKKYDKIYLLYRKNTNRDKLIIRKLNLRTSDRLKMIPNKLINETEIVDHIYFINLPHRKDRFIHITNQLKKMRFTNISLIKAIYLPNTPQIGCALSHLSALKDAYINKYKTIMILEDDFTFNISRSEFNKKINNVYKNFKRWDVIQLSSINYKTQKTFIDQIDKVIKADTTSAYITNLNTIPLIFNVFKTCINPNPLYKSNQSAIDVAWQSLQPNLNWFILQPMLGYQNERFYSDIEKYRLNNWTI